MNHPFHRTRLSATLAGASLAVLAAITPASAQQTADADEGADDEIVVTGTLERYKREEIEALIEQLGGRAGSSVSKKTDFLVAGADAGSKLAKAQKLGVRIITEAEFDQLISEPA